MSIVVVGAGGLGSYLAAILTRAGQEVHLVVRGAHGDKVRSDGLQVHSADGDFVARPSCVDSAAAIARPHIAFVTVKAHSLADVGAQLRHLAQQGALVVPLLNGIDATDRLQELGVPADSLVAGVAYLTAFRTGPGVVERKGKHQRMFVGSPDGPNHERLATVVEIFEDTGVQLRVSDDIRLELWRKMAVVCALSALCGITNGPPGPIRGHPLGSTLQARAVAEVTSVARAVGVPLPEDEEARVSEILDAFSDDFYPSVLHDLRRGRKTEIEALSGTISRLGSSVGVETPLHDAATIAVQSMEAGRQ